MSAIAGICYWDGRSIDEADVALIAGRLRAAGPDGGGTVFPQPGVAMQAHVLHFDRLATLERQPYVFDGGSVLTWDGRLDNRDDLLVTLHRHLGRDTTDAAVVSAAYERWGLDFLSRLVGDWSLALLDARQQRLVLARDYMGNRPLYYLELPGGLAWASNLDALAECFDLYRRPDESYIAGLLTFGVPPGVTPFAGARALRAGHLLLASQQTGVTTRRYWTFQPATIRLRTQQDYADRLRSLLIEAVRVRLRAHGRVWAHLSGGWDTSALVCLAHALMQTGQVEAAGLQPISRVATASPESDESSYIEAVEKWCGLNAVRREFTGGHPRFQDLLGYRRPFTHGAEDALERPMTEAGDCIVLSGEMGDLVMVRGAMQVVSLLEPLHEGHLLQFLRLAFARARRRQRPLPFVLARVALAGYLPALDQAVARRRRDVHRARELGVRRRNLADFFGVTQDLLERAPDVAGGQYPSVTGFSLVKRPTVSALYEWADSGVVSNLDFRPSIWRTFPFTHRPLVDFVLGSPQLAFWDPMTSRAGMKRALADVLPPDILARRSKGDPRAALARNASAAAAAFSAENLSGERLADWQIVTRGYVPLVALTRAVRVLAQGMTTPLAYLERCIALEAWLQTLVGTRSASAPRRSKPVDGFVSEREMRQNVSVGALERSTAS